MEIYNEINHVSNIYYKNYKKIVAAFREMCKMYIQHRVHVLLIAIFKSTSECSADPGMLS